MKKFAIAFTSVSLLLGACSNASNDKNSTASVINQNSVQEIFQITKDKEGTRLELNIDPRDKYFGNYLKNGQFNVNSIKINSDENLIEKKLGKAISVSTDKIDENMANEIGIKDFNKFSEKYKDVLEVTSYEYDNFVVNVSQKKVHSIDINILNISEDIQKKIEKENKKENDDTVDFNQIEEETGENLTNILSKNIEKDLSNDAGEKYVVIKTNDSNYLLTSIIDKKMTPRFIVANKDITDLTYDIMKIRMNES